MFMGVICKDVAGTYLVSYNNFININVSVPEAINNYSSEMVLY